MRRDVCQPRANRANSTTADTAERPKTRSVTQPMSVNAVRTPVLALWRPLTSRRRFCGASVEVGGLSRWKQATTDECRVRRPRGVAAKIQGGNLEFLLDFSGTHWRMPDSKSSSRNMPRPGDGT
jgi:hypothetical protein